MSVERGKGGLFASLNEIAAILLIKGETRLELLGNEIEEEKLHILNLLLLVQGILLSAGLFVLLFVFFMTAAFWEYRLIVLGVASAFFLIAGIVLISTLRNANRKKKHVFADSISELREDVRQLKAMMKNGQETQ